MVEGPVAGIGREEADLDLLVERDLALLPLSGGVKLMRFHRDGDFPEAILALLNEHAPHQLRAI